MPAPNQPVPADLADPTVHGLNQLAQATPQIIHQPAVNVSHFKPELSSRPEEDVEAHLPHTNGWMETHDFQQGAKVQRFCLPLIGEARLWHVSLRPIANDCPAFQENFRQHYSKIGNTRDQLFHAWRSFHYDENMETGDIYVNRIRQIAAM